MTPPAAIYLDTCALVRRAEASVPSPEARNTHAGMPVASLLSQPGDAVAICEVGLLEFHDVVTSLWRDTDAGKSQYDDAWAEKAISMMMGDIDAGRLTIKQSPAKAFEQAMTLVTMAARDYGRKFRVWDAVHLVTATDWALELGLVVELWTTDTDFEKFLAAFPHFATCVSIRNLDV